MTAYEELKAWCEKHLGKNEYNAQNDNGEGLPYIDLYFEDKEVTIWFFEDGSYSDFDYCINQGLAPLKEDRG